jgi:hypothetical protein
MVRETSVKITVLMVVTEIALALLIGGAAYRILGILMH